MISIPIELEHEIFKFAGYKLRNGVYMAQINTHKKSQLQNLLLEKPKIIKNRVIIDLYSKKYHGDYITKVLRIDSIYNSYTAYYCEEYDGYRSRYEPSIPW